MGDMPRMAYSSSWARTIALVSEEGVPVDVIPSKFTTKSVNIHNDRWYGLTHGTATG